MAGILNEKLTGLHQLNSILEGLISDSPKAMKSIFDLFYKPLCVHAMRYAHSMPVAEEIVSDVMFKVWQNRHKGYRPDTFFDYLYTATRNNAINYMKHQQTQKLTPDNWTELLRDELIEETPLDLLIAKETLSNLNKLIDSLPEQCRKVFIMRRMEDLSYDEIADKMNISKNTVKFHMKTALQRLHAEIDSILVCLIILVSSLTP